MDSKDKQISYSLEEVKTQIQYNLHNLTEFENEFKARFERSRANKKDGAFLSNDEFECIIKFYRYIQQELQFRYEVLNHSLKHQHAQLQLFEATLRNEIMTNLKSKAA